MQSAMSANASCLDYRIPYIQTRVSNVSKNDFKNSHFTIERAKRATFILQLIWILTTKSYLSIPILTGNFCSFEFCYWFSNPSGNGDSMSPLWWGSLWLFLPIWWLVMHETICRECIRHRSFFHSISPKNSQSLTTTWKIRLFVFFRHKINLTTNRQKRKMERRQVMDLEIK